MSLDHFNNKVVIITGASSGIGYAVAEKLLPYAKIIVLISHDPKKLQAAHDRLSAQKMHAKLMQVVADVGETEPVQTACRVVVEQCGAPDIVINNAGYAHYQLFHEMPLEEVVRHADVNLIGAMRITHCFLPAMRAARRGQIVNVSSIAGHMLITPNLVYAAAKHGMVAWSEGLALELAPDNISVHIVSPGRVETSFFDHITFKERAAGAETKMTVPLAHVVDVTLAAIARVKKVTIVPRYWALIAWSLQAGAWLLKPLYHTILGARLGRLRQKH